MTIGSFWNNQKIYNLDKTNHLDCLKPGYCDTDDFVESTDFSTCETYLMAATTNGTITIWDTDNYGLMQRSNMNLSFGSNFNIVKNAYFKSCNPNNVVVVTENKLAQRLNILDMGAGRYSHLASKEFVDCSFVNLNCLPNDVFFLNNSSREIGHLDLRSHMSTVIGNHHGSSFSRLFMSETDPHLFTVMCPKTRYVIQYDMRMYGSVYKSFVLPQ